jgi:hypothetical protein
MSMAERRIYEVIQDGLQVFKDNPAALERWALEMLELDAEEAAKLRLYFAGGTNPDDGETIEARPPILVHGYPRVDGPFPCWAMTLGAETIEQDYLGKDAPFLDSDGEKFYNAETGEVVDPKARRLTYRYEVLVITDHPDITVYYYHLLKLILMSNQTSLEAADVEDFAFTGADLTPDPRFLPPDVFARVLTITVSGDEVWCEDLRATYGRSVSGIAVADAVDSEGRGITAGDDEASVRALVTPYTEES